MRILLVSHAPKDPDAGASGVHHLVEQGLRERGHSVKALHFEDFHIPKALERIISRIFLPQMISWRLSSVNLDEYDVVMMSSGMLYPLFARLKAKSQRPLLVHQLHGLAYFDHQARITENMRGHLPLSSVYRLITGPAPLRYDELGSRHADLTIVLTGRDLDFAQEQGFPSPVCIPLAVHPELMHGIGLVPPPEERDSNSLLWFGSWVERKGVSYLPRAFAQIADRHPEARLTIGGTRMDEAAILKFFEPELRSKIRVLGRISRSEQIAEFGRHAIFLFPSISEGFGFALLEAMYLGLAAVTTHTGFGVDLPLDHQTAMMVPPASALHLALAVNTLIEQPELRCEIARNGQKFAQQFTSQQFFDSFEDAFKNGLDVLQKKPT